MASEVRGAAMSVAFGGLAAASFASAGTVGTIVFGQKSPSTPLIALGCFLAFTGLLATYMTFAEVSGWWPTGRSFEGSHDPSMGDNELHKQLVVLRDTLVEENEAQAVVLVGRGELPVPWRISAKNSGKNASDLCEKYVLMDVPQLIILGNAGAGKTTMATLLAKELFQKADSFTNLGGFPVRVSVASWTSTVGTLQKWTFAELGKQYPLLPPCLDVLSRLGYTAESIFGRLLIPIFDGFDEIKETERVNFLRMLARDFARSPMILTSRIAEYEKAKSVAVPLSCAAEVSMRPVARSHAWEYLKQAAKSPRDSWKAVFGSSNTELKDALKSPLLLWLMAEVYPCVADDPRELLALTAEGAVESHLLLKLVPSAFDRAVGMTGPHGEQPAARVSGDQAVGKLAWLASGLARRESVALRWWRLQDQVPRLGVILAAAVLGGTVIGFFFRETLAIPLLTAALTLGACFGFGFGRGYSSARMRGTMPSDRIGFGGKKEGEDPDIRDHLYRLGGSVLGTAAFWLSAQMVEWHDFSNLLGQGSGSPGLYQASILESFATAALACTVVAFLGGHVLGESLRSFGASDVKQTGARAVTPQEALKRDRWNTLKIAPIAYIISGAAIVAVFYPALRWNQILMELTTGAACLITYSLVFPAWARYRVAHAVLAIFGILPWTFMQFLEDAHHFGVLRQTGLSYQFRHELLRKSLVNRKRN
jgi:hypothetical protein